MYTDKARQAHIQGDVLLQAMVGPDGVVRQVLVEKSLDTRFGLDQRAIAAVRQWEYKPARRSGEPILQIVRITVPFQLPDAAGLQPAPVAEETFPTVEPAQSGLVWPKLKRQVAPTYTVAGLRAKIQGTVRIDAVVLPNGTVGAVRVLQSLDREDALDDQAMGAAREWEFEPATLNGRPVASRIQIALAFRLH